MACWAAPTTDLLAPHRPTVRPEKEKVIRNPQLKRNWIGSVVSQKQKVPTTCVRPQTDMAKTCTAGEEEPTIYRGIGHQAGSSVAKETSSWVGAST